MKSREIPFSENEPNIYDLMLLKQLGLSAYQKNNKYYIYPIEDLDQLQIQKSSHLRSTTYSFYYYQLPVMTVQTQKVSFFKTQLNYSFNKQNIQKAVSKLPDTQFSKDLNQALEPFVRIYFNNDNSEESEQQAAQKLQVLRELREQNPQEHDRIINANFRYQKIAFKFPDWQDQYGLLQQNQPSTENTHIANPQPNT